MTVPTYKYEHKYKEKPLKVSAATITVGSTGRKDLGMTLGAVKLYSSWFFASRQFDKAVSRTLTFLRRRGGIDLVLVWEIQQIPSEARIYQMLLEARQP
jgi:hypothetical protein